LKENATVFKLQITIRQSPIIIVFENELVIGEWRMAICNFFCRTAWATIPNGFITIDKS
jgi:hypothetical protein